MAPFAERLAAARALARHPRIRVVDLEDRLGTRYTVDTLAALRPALSAREVRLADGRRHPRRDAALEGLARDILRAADCRLRAAYLLS